MKASQVDIDVDSVMIRCTARDLKANFGWLLSEMRALAKQLRAEERDVLRVIMNHTGVALTVRAVFPQFTREGEAHRTLRRLRAGKFIRPTKTGRWEPDEPIEPTPFARMMWDRMGEDRIFTPHAKPKSPSTSTRTPAPKSAVTWDNLLERIHERKKQPE